MQEIFEVIVIMSLQGMFIFSIVFLVRFLLKKIHISHKYIVLFWFVLFFYLVFPWKMTLPGGFWNNDVIEKNNQIILNTTNVQTDIKEKPKPTIQVDVPANMQTNTDNAIVDTNEVVAEKTVFRVGKIMSYVWVIVAGCLYIHLIYSYILIRKRLVLRTTYKDNIFLAEDIQTPMVFGVLCPKIFLPIHIEQKNLKYVIEHEQMHIKRKDALWKILAYVICIVHWFNPLVWLAYYLLGSDIEKACDEAVIRQLGEENKKDYARALLHAAEGTLCKKKRVFVAPICFDEGDVKGRIKNIVKYKYTFPIVGAFIVVVAVVLTVVFLTDRDAEEKVWQRIEQENLQEKEQVIVEKESTKDTQNSETNEKHEMTTDVVDNENIVRGEFKDIMGYDGYTIRDKSTVYPCNTCYYAIEGDSEFLIAESWNFEDKEDDYAVDIDGDGVNELVCNCTYGDGAQVVIVYKREGYYTLQGFAGDLSSIDYVNNGPDRPLFYYRPLENMVEILYQKDTNGELLSTKQALSMDIIVEWREFSDATNDKREQAYISVLENVLYNHTFPDGVDRGYDGLGSNKFSICDVDDDGAEELILVYITTYMAGQETIIYDYDMEADSVREEFSEFPALDFFKNGVIEAKTSHNHGRASDADDFWPYTLYTYDESTDTYVRIASVDAWNKSFMSEDGEGNMFPEDVDVNGDGRVYSIMTGDEYTWENPVDNWKYKAWRESYIYSDSAKKKINYKELNEENIRWITMVD